MAAVGEALFEAPVAHETTHQTKPDASCVPVPYVLCPGPPIILDNFPFNGAGVRPHHIPILKGIAGQIEASQHTSKPIHAVCLEGHTDNTGQPSYNEPLGRRRALAVQAELVKAMRERGPNLYASMHTLSEGARRPVADNATEPGRARNRRVEIYLNSLDPNESLSNLVPSRSCRLKGKGSPPKTAPITTIAIRNRLIREVVPDCAIELVGAPRPIRGKSGGDGRAKFTLRGAPDGAYILRLTPKHTSIAPVGPGTPAVLPGPDRVWRALDVPVTVRNGRIIGARHPDVWITGGTVTVRLQPVWMKSPNHSSTTRAATAITLCVVHHTAQTPAESPLNTFMNRAVKRSAHYVVDIDGQIIKLVHEDREAFHAGDSHWLGRDNVNAFSIGIEVVHRDGPYPAAQAAALMGLLGRIRAAFPTIPTEGIVGHSDIGTAAATARLPRRLGRKSGDPGPALRWEDLEAGGLGLRGRRVPPVSIYRGFFVASPASQLRPGDSDARRVYGGTRRSTMAGVMRELQTDLRDIGYFCSVSGTFDTPTQAAVTMFQEHVFSGGRARAPHPGWVDRRTAIAIKSIRP